MSQKQIDNLVHEQNKDRARDRRQSVEKEELAKFAPGGVATVFPGRQLGVPTIDERFQEDRKRQLTGERHQMFLRMCPGRERAKMPGHDEWEAWVRRKNVLEDIKVRAPKPRTQMLTVIKFVNELYPEPKKMLAILKEDRWQAVLMIMDQLKYAMDDLDNWAASITDREELAVARARKKRAEGDTRSIMAKRLKLEQEYKAGVRAQREVFSENGGIDPGLPEWQQQLAQIDFTAKPKIKEQQQKSSKPPKVKKHTPRPKDQTPVTQSDIQRLRNHFGGTSHTL